MCLLNYFMIKYNKIDTSLSGLARGALAVPIRKWGSYTHDSVRQNHIVGKVDPLWDIHQNIAR